MISFLLALQFLTIVPLKIKRVSDKRIAGAMAYFPIIGLLLGLFLSAINALLLSLNFSPLATDIILVIILIIITGGMHLDGLADTSDALLSNKPKDQMLAIMRDPHIGVMGVLSLISIIILKVGLLSSISPGSKTIALLLMAVLSRWGAVWMTFIFPYAREEGKAKVFFRGINLSIFLLSLLTVSIFAFAIWRIKGLLALLVIAGSIYLGGKFICGKISGITGDTLGAAIELSEILILFIVCIA